MTKQAVQDKHYLESLAFAVLVKYKYRSSSINNPTYRKLQKEFKIGNNRIKRIVSNGVKFELLRKDGDQLIANRVKSVSQHGEKYYNYRFDLSGEYSLSQMIDLIRETVIVNHIKIKTELVDSHKKAEGKSKGFIKKKRTMPTVSDIDNVEALSYTRIMQIANVKRYRVPKLMKSLLSKNIISKKERLIDTNIDPKEFETHFKMFQTNSPFRGFLRRHNNKIVLQTSNIYKYTAYNVFKISLI